MSNEILKHLQVFSYLATDIANNDKNSNVFIFFSSEFNALISDTSAAATVTVATGENKGLCVWIGKIEVKSGRVVPIIFNHPDKVAFQLTYFFNETEFGTLNFQWPKNGSGKKVNIPICLADNSLYFGKPEDPSADIDPIERLNFFSELIPPFAAFNFGLIVTSLKGRNNLQIQQIEEVSLIKNRINVIIDEALPDEFVQLVSFKNASNIKLLDEKQIGLSAWLLRETPQANHSKTKKIVLSNQYGSNEENPNFACDVEYDFKSEETIKAKIQIETTIAGETDVLLSFHPWIELSLIDNIEGTGEGYFELSNKQNGYFMNQNETRSNLKKQIIIGFKENSLNRANIEFKLDRKINHDNYPFSKILPLIDERRSTQIQDVHTDSFTKELKLSRMPNIDIWNDEENSLSLLTFLANCYLIRGLGNFQYWRMNTERLKHRRFDLTNIDCLEQINFMKLHGSIFWQQPAFVPETDDEKDAGFTFLKNNYQDISEFDNFITSIKNDPGAIETLCLTILQNDSFENADRITRGISKFKIKLNINKDLPLLNKIIPTIKQLEEYSLEEELENYAFLKPFIEKEFGESSFRLYKSIYGTQSQRKLTSFSETNARFSKLKEKQIKIKKFLDKFLEFAETDPYWLLIKPHGSEKIQKFTPSHNKLSQDLYQRFCDKNLDKIGFINDIAESNINAINGHIDQFKIKFTTLLESQLEIVLTLSDRQSIAETFANNFFSHQPPTFLPAEITRSHEDQKLIEFLDIVQNFFDDVGADTINKIFDKTAGIKTRWFRYHGGSDWKICSLFALELCFDTIYKNLKRATENSSNDELNSILDKMENGNENRFGIFGEVVDALR